MALIKLTALTHPDVNGGKPYPAYVDASRILLIVRSNHRWVKMAAQDLKLEAYEELWSGMKRLTKLLNDKMPTEIDNQQAAAWAKQMHMLLHDLQEFHSAWARAYRAEDHYPPVECTELQLACGTALEHGVMLARISVVETPEQVADLIKQPRLCGHCGHTTGHL